ncbi:hypothetical protein [Pontibacter arcticus]|uniref:Lipocalin-like domain-containing protein n=1 Tax=Pontibacter arcticus TaxID=2080288 RepID=A0A364RCM1_9BACT|nr:hypothetical protein [Pontibacter arcticus]RAU81896.1 hypothetical protein DP923_14510 [Pontibacter arcticus]
MTKHTFRTLLLMLLSLTVFTACDSDDDEDTTLTNTDLITAETWKGDEIRVPALDALNISYKDRLPDPKTMTIKFDRNGTYEAQYTLNGQSTKTTGDWEFTDNERKLSGNFFNFPSSEADIDELSATQLHLSTMITAPNIPIPVKAEVRLVR